MPNVNKGCKILKMQREEHKKFPLFSTVCNNFRHSCQFLFHWMQNASNVRCAGNGNEVEKVWRIVLPLSNSPWVYYVCYGPYVKQQLETETFQNFLSGNGFGPLLRLSTLLVVSVSFCHQRIDNRCKIQNDAQKKRTLIYVWSFIVSCPYQLMDICLVSLRPQPPLHNLLLHWWRWYVLPHCNNLHPHLILHLQHPHLN